MNADRVYERLEFESLDHALVEIASGDPGQASRALLAASLEAPEPAWVEACAIAFCAHDDRGLNRAGLLALGHVARRFGSLNTAAAARVLNRLADTDLSGAVEDLRSDLQQWGIL